MSLVSKLYRSRTRNKRDGLWHVIWGSDVVDKVRELEASAAERGLTVSRWQTNSKRRGWVKNITWAVHFGLRPRSSAKLLRGSLQIVLNSTEGTSTCCEAYHALHRLLVAMEERYPRAH
jgi:hypothetical protein